MPLIEWNESLSVNVAEIDAQHRRLVEMINDLNEALKQGKGKDVLGEIVNGLASYAMTHFSTEEKYFDQFGYPETKEHKNEHSEFVGEVSKFTEGFEKGTLGLSIHVMTFLSDWLKKHIQGSDKKYSSFFNEKGLK